jgi:hypothetical protein
VEEVVAGDGVGEGVEASSSRACCIWSEVGGWCKCCRRLPSWDEMSFTLSSGVEGLEKFVIVDTRSRKDENVRGLHNLLCFEKLWLIVIKRLRDRQREKVGNSYGIGKFLLYRLRGNVPSSFLYTVAWHRVLSCASATSSPVWVALNVVLRFRLLSFEDEILQKIGYLVGFKSKIRFSTVER